jgi:glycosyltransferase involved in cell wall biosynthesis
VEGRALRVLIVSFYFPPAGGGGVQRVLALCRNLPDLGFEVHVLAPDDPKWEAHDPGLLDEVPASTIVHRARYRGPSQRQSPAARLAEAEGAHRLALRGRLAGRRLLLPDPEVVWWPDAVRVGTRVAREHHIDAVLSTSPPASVHLIGAAIARRAGARLVTDFRDSWLAHPHRRYERRSVRAKRAAEARMARRLMRRTDAITAVTDAIRAEAVSLAPPGVPAAIVPNGVDFAAFEGLPYEPSDRLRLVHAGSFFGERSPRPFLGALRGLLDDRPELGGRIEARFLGAFRPADRDWAAGLELGDALRIEGFQPHAETRRAMAGADALLLLIPQAGGRGRSVLSGKVYEYVAAGRPILALVPPDGAAAALVRDTAAGVVADPDDPGAIRAALEELVQAWEAGPLTRPPLPEAWRDRLDRRGQAKAVAVLLRGEGRESH